MGNRGAGKPPTLEGHHTWDPAADPRGDGITGDRALVAGLTWSGDGSTARAFGLMALKHRTRFVVMADPLPRASGWLRREPRHGFLSEAVCSLLWAEPGMLQGDPLGPKRIRGIDARGWPLPNVAIATWVEDGEDAGRSALALIGVDAADRLIALPASGFRGDLLPWHLAEGWTCRWTVEGGRRRMGPIAGL